MSDEDLQSVASGQVIEVESEDEAKTRLAASPVVDDDGDGDPPTRSQRPPRKTSDPPAKDRRIGQVLSGRYRLEKLIGKGGMGRVYLATQFPLNRAVAVKILNPEFQRKDPQFVRRFFLEAATAARLSHPNTITVFDYGETDRKELYIAMEYLKGRPLSRVLATEGPFIADRAMHVALQIVRALREAHAKGIIHRDLKPGNIMLLEEGDDADYAKVLDFGLVKLFHPDGEPAANLDLLTPSQQGDDLTRAGMFLGSPKYMSPEQIQGSDLDPRTDIYSLGVILYQMLTGRPPFRGSTSVEIIYKHVNQPVPPIHELHPEADCAPELEEVVMKCLAKNREQRFASMSELRAALKEVRRALTGVSSATGSGLSNDLLRLRQATDPSLKRPQTHPSLSIPPLASHAPEAAFADPTLERSTDESSAEQGSARPLRGPSPLARAAPWVAGFSLVLVLGGLAYVLSRPDPAPAPVAPTQPAPPPAPVEVAEKPTQARLFIHSSPEGAAVTEDGLLIGTTPFEHLVPLGIDGPVSRRFVFTKDGYQDETLVEKIDVAELKIRASLRKKPEPAPPPKPAPAKPRPKPGGKNEPADYKDNPY